MCLVCPSVCVCVSCMYVCVICMSECVHTVLCECVRVSPMHVHVCMYVCACACVSWVCVCLCTGRGRLQTVPTLHTSDSSGGWSHPPQTPKPSMTPPPDRAALLLGTHHPEVTMRPGLPSWEVPPLLPRGSALLCVPRLWLLTHSGPSSLSDGRKECLLHAVSLAWALPPERPRNSPSRWSWQHHLCALPGQSRPR